MAELNKILDAEKNVLKIEEELARLKNAADLLVGAQIKTDNVIVSAEAIVDATKQFVKSSEDIVTKLANVDIIAKLDALDRTNIEQIKELGELQKRQSAEVEGIRTIIEKDLGDMTAVSHEIEKRTLDKYDDLAFAVRKAIDGQEELARINEATKSQLIKLIGSTRLIVIFALIASLASLIGSVAFLIIK